MGSEIGLPRSQFLLLPPTAFIWASSDMLTRVTKAYLMHNHPHRQGARDRNVLQRSFLERAVHWVHLLSCCSSGTDTYRSAWQTETCVPGPCIQKGGTFPLARSKILSLTQTHLPCTREFYKEHVAKDRL